MADSKDVDPTLLVASSLAPTLQAGEDVDATLALAALSTLHDDDVVDSISKGGVPTDDVAPVEPTPEVPSSVVAASSTPLTAETLMEVTANDLDDLVAAMSSHGGSSVKSDGLGLASVATPAGGFTLHDLFGEFFHTGLVANGQKKVAQEQVKDAAADAEWNDYDIIDPELLDSRTVVENYFGRHVDEAMIDTMNNDPLRKLMRDAAKDDARADLQSCFGEHVTPHHLKDRLGDSTELRGGFAILHATMPPISDKLAHTKGELWLAELPKVDPNRQVLHVEPNIFRPSIHGVSLPPSNDRRLYTTQNIIRWTYLKERKEVLSNARLVCWSDGSRTIHVGRDRFEVAQSSQNSLALLGAPTQLYKSDKVMPGVVGVQSYDNRVLIKVSDAPSISSEIVGETQVHREIGMERRLSFANDAPLPRVDAKKPKADMTSEEQWVLREREARKKEMARREAAGNPMSVLEQLEEERKMMQKLQLCTNIKDLLEEQETFLSVHTTGGNGGHNSRYREPDLTLGSELESNHRRSNGDEDVDEEVQLGSVAVNGSLADIMADMNSDRNTATSKRPRSPDADASPVLPLKQARADTSGTTSAPSSSSSSSSWTVDVVRTSLLAAQASLPPKCEVGELIDSVLSMLVAPGGNWTASKLQAEVRQIVGDIEQELGQGHRALEQLNSLQAQL